MMKILVFGKLFSQVLVMRGKEINIEIKGRGAGVICVFACW